MSSLAGFRAWLYRRLFPAAKLYFRIFRPKTRGVAVVLEHNGRILLLRNTYGSRAWGFPGGGRRRHEDPAQAAARELNEETGLAAGSLRLLGQLNYEQSGRQDTVHVFFGNAAETDLTLDRGEILEARWLASAEIATDKMTYVGRLIWELYQKEKTRFSERA